MKAITIILAVCCVGLTSCKMFRDTEGWDIKSKYNENNTVFLTNSKFIYTAYRIKEGDTLRSYVVNHLDDTLTVNKLALTVLPGRFFKQTKMKWEYLNTSDSVVIKSITGLRENEALVWVHPAREGMPFVYTEAAPFPKIEYPLEKGKEWKSELGLVKGESYEAIGLAGAPIKYEYRIEGKETIKTEFRELKGCWKVMSKGESKIGTSTHEFFFHEKYGFVHSEYNFPSGEKLIITLNNYK